ncbi:MAG: hypothetical protein OXT09_21515 [Myxococcales bacterium]|nr:hypothetical protein [Myxococcales bacterium]
MGGNAARSKVGDVLGVEELGRTEGCVNFAWGNITITVYKDQATLDTVRMLMHVGRVMRERHAARSAVSFVLDGVPPPSEDAREPFSQLVHAAPSAISAMSTILEGEGFWASTLRSVIIGMKIEAGGQAAVEVHHGIEETVAWLPGVHHAKTGVEVNPSRLTAVLRRARALALDT